MVVSFNFHPERCVGCGACVMACLDLHDTDLDHTPPLRHLFRTEEERGGRVEITHYSTACMHCPDMPCGGACPKKLFSKDPSTGLTVLEAEGCVGCRACAGACPYQAIGYTVENRAVKCDGCPELIQEGRLPACVAACPRDAITVDEKNQVLKKGRKALLEGIDKALSL